MSSVGARDDEQVVWSVTGKVIAPNGLRYGNYGAVLSLRNNSHNIPKTLLQMGFAMITDTRRRKRDERKRKLNEGRLSNGNGCAVYDTK